MPDWKIPNMARVIYGRGLWWWLQAQVGVACEGEVLFYSKNESFFQLPGSEKTKTEELFTTRRNQYRMAALTCKKAGDIQQAKQFLAVSKVKKPTI